jgi:hypothetical protein
MAIRFFVAWPRALLVASDDLFVFVTICNRKVSIEYSCSYNMVSEFHMVKQVCNNGPQVLNTMVYKPSDLEVKYSPNNGTLQK